MSKKYKICIGLVEIAGYYSNLKKGFDMLGIENSFINLYSNPFNYKGENKTILTELIKYFNNIHFNTPKTTLLKLIKKVISGYIRQFLLILLFLYALCKYDVFIFGFGISFFEKNTDFPILKFFKKKIICVFNGSDSRPPYINGSFKGNLFEELLEATYKQKAKIKYIDKYADYVVNNPSVSHFHERPVVNWLKIGLPVYINTNLQKPNFENKNEIIQIVHAPSHPKAKGTFTVRKVIEELKAEGYKIDYIELINKNNDEVINCLKNCDFVIDQLYSDFIMAGFAAEAASFGKPSIIGGYELDKSAKYLEEEEIPPALCIHPDKLKEGILKLITDNDFRINLGKAAYNYIATKRYPKKVAENYLAMIEGKISNEYYFSPQELDFIYGCGVSQQRRDELINMLLKFGGEKALNLEDKPVLKQKLLDSIN